MSTTLIQKPSPAVHQSAFGRPIATPNEWRFLVAGVLALALHLVITALAGPATSIAGIVAIGALAGAAIALYPRLRRRTRAAWSGVLGLVVTGALGSSDLLGLMVDGVSPSEASGALAALGGLSLIAASVSALRSPREPARGQRVLRGIGWAAGAVVVGLLVVFPLALTLTTTHAPRLPISEASLDWPHQEVRIPMRDGGEVAAWYIESRNGAAVLLIHGSGGNRSRVADRARMLARHGYGVLVLDLPGNGESDGRSNGLGWTAQPGIDAALDYLSARPDVDNDRIAGFGVSLGGEVLLEAASRDRRLSALVSDGAARSTIDSDLNAPEGFAGALQKAQLQVGMRLISAVSGTHAAPPLEGLVGRIAPRPVMLIASGHGPEVSANRTYRDAAGTDAKLWVIPEASHTGGLRSRPADYERRTTRFLDSALN
jgi:pimeloyl-ACP methyl ester carboxylesterase